MQTWTLAGPVGIQLLVCLALLELLSGHGVNHWKFVALG